ncbi:MAG: hypothetical protein K6G26_12315 [Lachnospiraceae bacterium]|nr:hypothetical protein [Lachnospiraceae bacterium]
MVVGYKAGTMGFIAGFEVGSAAAGHIFMPIASVPIGILTGGVGAAFAYKGGKAATGEAWDAVAKSLKK